MYLDLEDYRPETPHLERVISLREGVLLSIIAHLVVALMFAYAPDIPFLAKLLQPSPEEIAARQAEMERLRQQQEAPRFVYVQPKIEMPSPPPPRAEASDRDRMARAPERAPNPTNPLPYSRGNTTERIDSDRATEKPRGQGPAPEPSTDSSQGTGQDTNSSSAFVTERGRETAALPTPGRGGAPPGGALGQALKNLQKYTDDQKFNNPDGGGAFGPAIQFDTKGVEFGPWIRRFVAQVKRNWFIPYAAMSFRGHVVVTFNVHKDGRITDVTVVGPSQVEAFNTAAFNAILGSNPTQPLPPEYPSDKAFFTVTFFYNEQPPQ